MPIPFPPPTNVPIIGEPKIAGSIVFALVLCSCQKHTPMIVQSNVPSGCGDCGAVWGLQVEGSLTPVRIQPQPQVGSQN